MRSLRGEALRDLTPQFLRALRLGLFTKSSFSPIFYEITKLASGIFL